MRGVRPWIRHDNHGRVGAGVPPQARRALLESQHALERAAGAFARCCGPTTAAAVSVKRGRGNRKSAACCNILRMQSRRRCIGRNVDHARAMAGQCWRRHAIRSARLGRTGRRERRRHRALGSARKASRAAGLAAARSGNAAASGNAAVYASGGLVSRRLDGCRPRARARTLRRGRIHGSQDEDRGLALHDDIGRVRAARDAIGPDVTLWVDARQSADRGRPR